jgi:hypothetical protein
VKSLYFFVILLLIIPQGAFDIFLINLPAVHKVTPYVIIQSCLALTGAMAINKDAPIFKFYAIKYMVVAFSLLLIMAVINSYYSSYDLNPIYSSYATSLGAISGLSTALFLLLLFSPYLNNQRVLNGLVKIFTLFGVIMIVESLLYFYLELNFLPLYGSVIGHGGRYTSLFIGDYNSIILYSLLSILSMQYMYLISRKNIYRIMMYFLIFPLIATGQRASIVAILVFFIVYSYTQSRHFIIKSTLIIASTFFVLLLSGGILKVHFLDLGSALASIFSRVLLFLQGLLVGYTSLPFGTGPGYVNEVTDRFSTIADTNFYNMLHMSLESEIDRTIDNAYSGERITNSHNLFVNFFTEHGLIGAITMGLFGYIVYKRFKLLTHGNNSNGGLFVNKINFMSFAVIVALSFYGFAQVVIHYWVWSILLLFLFWRSPTLSKYR